MPEDVIVTTDEAATNDSAHERDWGNTRPDTERIYTNPLPEDELLRGHFFAREANVACPPAFEVQAADGAAADQAQEESLTDSDTESEAQKGEQTESKNEDTREKDGQAEERAAETAQQEAEQTEKEAEKARKADLMRQEGLLRDPALFPANWFEDSKYDFDESQVRHHYVQDADTYHNRSRQLLGLAAQLINVFFEFHTEENGLYWISALGRPYSKDCINMKMPDIVERDGGVKYVYVDPSSHIIEIENEWNKRAREEENRQTGEENPTVTTNAATAVDEKAEGITEKRATGSDTLIYHTDAEEIPEAVKLSTGAPGLVPKDEDYEPGSAADLNLAKTPSFVKITTAAKKPIYADRSSNTYGDDSQDMATSRAEADTTPAISFADDKSASTAAAESPSADLQEPLEVVQLSEARLSSIPSARNGSKAVKTWILASQDYGVDEDEDEDEDDWTYVSAESHGNDAETVQVAAGSVFSRYVCRWRR
ncbi:hypothetical protein F5883DRAFT_722122 [Diaporthe sp. PMI_573]|nr:hypothetical protein F5883DRAFT_722122 [Diaporthaceae sp. PMI_573]